MPRQERPRKAIRTSKENLRAVVGTLVVLLTLVFGFLALFPELSRTEWFRSLGLLPPEPTTTPTYTNTPTITATSTPTGAPTEVVLFDSDLDGIPSDQDLCPFEFGPAQNYGCPVSSSLTSSPTAALCVPRNDWTETHTIQSGETLSSIALKYGVSTAELAQANCYADPSRLFAGQVLYVPFLLPAGTSSPTVTLTPSPDLTKQGLTPTTFGANSVALTATALAILLIEPTPAGIPTLETPVEVANVLFVIRDNAGTQLGFGTLRLYVPDEVRYPETALITLDVTIDSLLVTPTPGLTQKTTVPRMTSTPYMLGSVTPAPTQPIWYEQGVEVFQIMGASLICLESSFSGCTEQDARPIRYPGNTWTWRISPQKDVFGSHNLRIELWIPQIVNGTPGPYRVVSGQDFRINVTPSPQPVSDLGQLIANNFGAIVAALATVGAAIVGGYFLMANNRREKSPTKIPEKTSIQQNTPRPAVFISYRRSAGWGTARSIHDSLERRGVELFMDVEDINEGRFAEIIEQAIARCQNFVVVLAPDTLSSEWVKKEIGCALRFRKNIVPVMVDGFTFPDTLPSEISELSAFNGVRVMPEFFDAAIDKIVAFLK